MTVKRSLRLVLVLVVLLGLMAFGQSAMIGACPQLEWPVSADCPE